ncbi:MAG: ABC transporter ATP-binding protein [Candidatus Schekmanbacteria bacterium]|nr:ABC transporter ATP-binding protein [Candidatus Schekmanbacteria bacterium]
MTSTNPAGKTAQARLLDVSGLKTHFFTEDGVVKAVDGVDIHVGEAETVGLVGESGCGKSVMSLSVMRLIGPPGKIVEGRIGFAGRDLVALPERDMRKIRGNDIAMIFQEPMTSLNPVFTIGNQIAEAVRLHQGLGKREAMEVAVQSLKEVAIADPEQRVKEYPHQLSGGMRQRVMIAMALSCKPKLLIADEPTTALDVTIQAQILDLLAGLQQRFGLALLLITHDLAVVAEVCDRVAVMYAGNVVEEANVKDIFASPKHPYTQGLLRSVPRIDVGAKKKTRLATIEGTVPDPFHMPPGCRFAPRCSFAMEKCNLCVPEPRRVGPGHTVRCTLYDDVAVGDKAKEVA